MEIEEIKKVYFLNENGELYKIIPKSRRREGGLKKVNFKPNDKDGYSIVTFKGKPIKSHRLVVSLQLDRMLTSEEQVDHKDGDKLHNIPINLRVVSNRKNCSNKKIHREGKLVGVSKVDTGFRSQIRIGIKNVYLGVFSTKIEANNMYKKALENTDKYSGSNSEFRKLLGYTNKRKPSK